jgi:ABC-type sulfate transport system substrate-binding protein
MLTRFLAIALLAAGTVQALADELRIVNKSEYDIHELYVSSSHAKKWGPDQLGKNGTIDAGETYKITGIPEGLYDLKLVDEDGTECEVEDVDFSSGKVWTVTNRLLERCDKFGH